MRSLPAELLTELAKEYMTLAHLFTLTVSATEIYLWTDYKENIVYSGNWYTTKGITLSAVEGGYQGGAESITLEIDNVDKFFSTLALTVTLTGKELKIERVALDKNIQVVGTPVVIFLGYLDSMKIDRKKARVDAVNHLIKWRTIQCPRRLHSPSCQWIFKSSYCAYTGGEIWCDHTWERCEALANTLNFGGFPSISDMVNKEIWWGRKSSGSPI